jgi:hypothetical protein
MGRVLHMASNATTLGMVDPFPSVISTSSSPILSQQNSRHFSFSLYSIKKTLGHSFFPFNSRKMLIQT